jgi:hypothetical protein
LIEVRGDVSLSFVQRIDKAIKGLPEDVQRSVFLNGYRIAIVRSMAEAFPQLQNVQPRGWHAETTWQNTGGVYAGSLKRVVVAEKLIDPNSGQPADSTAPEEIMLHELGHCVDSHLAHSRMGPYLAAYSGDVQTILAGSDAATKEALSYFLQQGAGGPEETFAEVFACLYGSNMSRSSLMRKHFPQTCELVAGNMERLHELSRRLPSR